MRDVDARFRAHLPAPVHTANAKTRVPPAMGQADFEIWTGIHHPTKDKRSKRDRPVCQVADGIGEVIAARALAHHGGTPLMDEHQGAYLFCRFPEGEEDR